MSDADQWGRRLRDARPLTPQRWDALKRTAIRRAELARMEAMRAAFASLTTLWRRAWRRLQRSGRPVPTASAATLEST